LRYITIEGVDTAGKSTQIDILKEKYLDAIYTKEPGGTKLGESLRDIVLHKTINSPISEMFIFLADRAEHIAKLEKKYKNKNIISDRSLISGIAYAKVLDIDRLIELNKIATNNILPQKVVLLKLTYKELSDRLKAKSNDKIESRGVDYIFDIQNKLEETIKKLNIENLIIDATKPIEQIAKDIDRFIGFE